MQQIKNLEKQKVLILPVLIYSYMILFMSKDKYIKEYRGLPHLPLISLMLNSKSQT